jgi:hypothetical protein
MPLLAVLQVRIKGAGVLVVQAQVMHMMGNSDKSSSQGNQYAGKLQGSSYRVTNTLASYRVAVTE